MRSYSPDVAIVDIRLPPTHSDEGLQAALEIRSKYPDVAVLVLSQYVEVGLAMKLLADSAERTGYLLKDRISNVEDFVEAVRRVGEGGSEEYDPGVRRLVGNFPQALSHVGLVNTAHNLATTRGPAERRRRS